MSSREPIKVPASFRDPSGFVFRLGNLFYRQVNQSYAKEYDLLMNSGLFKKLVGKGLIINHKEINNISSDDSAYKTLLPEQIPFLSYPYEWSFSQLKDAALLTLEIQDIAIAHGMILKDASAYNIQFISGRPIFIDTLSFDFYKEGEPWVAYRQFCQHFLAPLALMSHTDLRFGKSSQIFLDGIPLDLAAHLLPSKTRFSLGLGIHIHLHARSQQKYTDPSIIKKQKKQLHKNQLLGIMASLKSTTLALDLPKQKTIWGKYYDDTNYTRRAFESKKKIISRWISKIRPKSVWDAGANDGTFSRLASSKKILTLATDIDELAIEKAYRQNKEKDDKYLLPLIIDLTNPSPAIGWRNKERASFLERNSFDLSMCLAFIHHLAIANNLPLSYICDLFHQCAKNIIIEFVPKEDSNTKRLLASREDIFPNYTQEDFEVEFSKRFKILQRTKIPGSKRIMYLMKGKG
ncbi:SAM-dependent methyltransferase [Candidatus Berkelbacteria bacterium CG10_big_fil_rev_8_21_14_0_10_41_12]|uniref:SAM-dependent methyltransferase n=1 Tax=Candidatus Berkelbacteria bacterium CG10_big_fil_rev_8_21_14_0_10_41_12 TaxID=1974513 RepID=A0A2M6WXC8_9BACT|nr:MAG: SAM-dependent methyltransferase [Candidatus Berkelbacteria bacterium CG10_big_fil_rev_8_21_14_0_10_41_12]